MIKYFLFPLLLVSISCAHDLKPHYVVDAPLVPFVEAFKADYNVEVNYNVRLVDLETRLYGKCVYNKVVYIDKNFFMNASDYYRDEIIRHELGHCVLDRDHNGEVYNDGPMKGCVKSIMHPSSFATANGCYRKFYKYYVDELINPIEPIQKVRLDVHEVH